MTAAAAAVSPAVVTITSQRRVRRHDPLAAGHGRRLGHHL